MKTIVAIIQYRLERRESYIWNDNVIRRFMSGTTGTGKYLLPVVHEFISAIYALGSRTSKLAMLLLVGIVLSLTSPGAARADSKDSIGVNPKTEYNECLIHFRMNQIVVDSGYMSNAKELRCLRSTISHIISDENSSVDSILIYVSSSPDGNFYTNQWLTKARVRSLYRYLYREFPKLKNEKVIITSDPENWSGLRQMIANDPQIPRQKEVLDIIDTASTPNIKKRALNDLDNGATYAYIIRQFSHHLRFGSVRAVGYSSGSDTIRSSAPVEYQVYAPDSMTTDSSVLDRALSRSTTPHDDARADTIGALYVPLQPSSSTAAAPSTVGSAGPRFALKTNLLYLAALCPNIEAELYIGKRWSINLEYQYAWWSNKSQHKYYRLSAFSPEVRYWFASKNRFSGHFAGIYVGAGLYEFMARPSHGIQGEFFIAGGVTYGWAFAATRWMNMELSIGVGYMMSEYREYYHDVDCYVYNDTQRFTYIGPTKAKVSLVFPLHSKKRLKVLN